MRTGASFVRFLFLLLRPEDFTREGAAGLAWATWPPTSWYDILDATCRLEGGGDGEVTERSNTGPDTSSGQLRDGGSGLRTHIMPNSTKARRVVRCGLVGSFLRRSTVCDLSCSLAQRAFPVCNNLTSSFTCFADWWCVKSLKLSNHARGQEKHAGEPAQGHLREQRCHLRRTRQCVENPRGVGLEGLFAFRKEWVQKQLQLQVVERANKFQL